MYWPLVALAIIPTSQETSPSLVSIDGPPLLPIQWTPCPGESNTGGRRAECASVVVPLRYGDPADTATMEIAVKRLTTGERPARHLWFLDGGPGDAGTASVGRLGAIFGDDEAIDLYTLDHRGVGGSAVLECPDQQAPASPDGREIVADEWPGCIAYLEANRPDLAAMSTTAAAHDLARVISATWEQDAAVFVLGVSYGSYWANRYLQLYPEQPDGVILDGIAPGDWTFAEFDGSLDAAGRDLLARCSDDGPCSTRLGGDPVAATVTLLEALEADHCPRLGIDRPLMQLVLGTALMIDAAPWGSIPPLIHRMRRCAWHDELAMVHLFREGLGVAAEEPMSHSQVLQRHVAMSELWPADFDSSRTARDAEGHLMTTGVGSSFARTSATWPAYPRTPLVGRHADYRGPLLMLHGGLDPTMTAARLRGTIDHFNGPHQRFVLFPTSHHVVINENPCAVSLYRQFLRDPRMPLDTACLTDLDPLSLELDVEQSAALFGTPDPWGDRIGVGARLRYALAFQAPALAVGLGIVMLGHRRLRRRASRFPRRRMTAVVAAAAGWGTVAWAAYHAGRLVPFLVDHRSAAAIGIVAAIAANPSHHRARAHGLVDPDRHRSRRAIGAGGHHQPLTRPARYR